MSLLVPVAVLVFFFGVSFGTLWPYSHPLQGSAALAFLLFAIGKSWGSGLSYLSLFEAWALGLIPAVLVCAIVAKRRCDCIDNMHKHQNERQA